MTTTARKPSARKAPAKKPAARKATTAPARAAAPQPQPVQTPGAFSIGMFGLFLLLVTYAVLMSAVFPADYGHPRPAPRPAVHARPAPAPAAASCAAAVRLGLPPVGCSASK